MRKTKEHQGLEMFAAMRCCSRTNSAFEPGEEGEHRLEVTDQNKAASSEVAGRKPLEISHLPAS